MDIVNVEEKLNAQLQEDYRAQKGGFVQVGAKKWFYPIRYRKLAEEFKNFEVRPDDIWITGYPRSGTTLTEELVWLLTHNLDFDKSKEVRLNDRVVFFELDMLLNENTEKEQKFPEVVDICKNGRNHLNVLNQDKKRRVIKTHLPFELLPPDVLNKGCKVIYVCRFPKDVCVSYYLLQKQNHFMDFCAGFENYWRYFLEGKSIFGPYFEHVKQGFEMIGSKNFTFVFYEEFRKDTRSYLRKLSEFLEIPLSEEEMEKLENFIDFDNYRKVNNIQMRNSNNELIEFVRRGKVDGWRDYFTEEMNKETDEWIERYTEKIGIRYPQQKA